MNSEEQIITLSRAKKHARYFEGGKDRMSTGEYVTYLMSLIENSNTKLGSTHVNRGFGEQTSDEAADSECPQNPDWFPDTIRKAYEGRK